MKRILTIALLLCLAAPAAAGGRYPEPIPLPNGWQPAGVATGRCHGGVTTVMFGGTNTAPCMWSSSRARSA